MEPWFKLENATIQLLSKNEMGAHTHTHKHRDLHMHSDILQFAGCSHLRFLSHWMPDLKTATTKKTRTQAMES